MPLLASDVLASNPQYKKLKSYIEMKKNLLLSYCTYLSFYLLMKLENKNTRDHPVFSKITNIKMLIDSLAPLDEKIGPSLLRISKKRNIKINEEQSQDADMDEEMEEDL